jgi:hypothetical protein
MAALGVAFAALVVAVAGDVQRPQPKAWGPFADSLPFGCVVTRGQGIDSAVGSLKCGKTTIQFDIGQMAGDQCSGRRDWVDLPARGLGGPMKLCAVRYSTEQRMAVSIPKTYENYYVVDPRADDVVTLIQVVQSLTERPLR